MSEQFNFWFGLISIIAGAIFLIWLAKKFWTYIKIFCMWFKSSFEENGKSSAKKITAFWFVVVVTVLEMRYLWYNIRSDDPDKFKILMEMINSDLIFIGACLGIKAITEIASKMGKKTETDTTAQP